MDTERQAVLAREFVTRERYNRVCAAAKERFGLTDERAQSLSLHWRRSGELGGKQEVVLVVGMVYRGHIGNTRDIVRFCRDFVEAELPLDLRGGQANIAP
jgi:hypothetical protein